MKKYLVMSCETSGLNFNDVRKSNFDENGKQYVAVSWGLIVVDEELNKLDEMYIEIDYTDIPGIIWDPQATKIHGLTYDVLRENGVPFFEAIEEIGSFVLTHFETGVINVISHNTATFTLPFFDDMFKRAEIDLSYSTNLIDMSTLGFVLLGSSVKRDIFDLMKMQTGKRNALVDARNILRCFQNISKMWNTLL